jgi:DNA repair ATPase RecN
LTGKTPLERVEGSEKLLERIMLVLPGFRGYKLREQRREADRIVRNHIYDVLEHSRDDLTRGFQALNDSKVAELAEPMNRLTARVDRIAEKVNHASYGYSGFFDSVKIEEPELDQMLAYDTQLMDLVRKFSDTVTSFRNDLSQSKLENARSSQQELESAIANLEMVFDQRKSVIEGVKV